MGDIFDHGEKQLVLYTKGWFEKDTIFNDIKRIMAEYFDSEAASYSLHNAYWYMLKVFLKLDKAGYVSGGIEWFMKELFKGENTISIEYVIERLYGQISIVKAAGLNLGEPDPSYLPLKKGDKVV